MTAPIGKGDWVECIDAGPDVEGNPVPLQLGASYLVASVVIGTNARGEEGECIVIDGLADGKMDLKARIYWMTAFDISRFRPIYRPKAEFIQSLKAPAPAKPVTAGEDA